MAQFYTLEEAARVLGMGPEDLKTKAQHREVRAFLDGGTWRFRVADVDELARRRGLGSDPELHLSDLDVPSTPSGSSDDLDLSEFQMGAAKPALGDPTAEHSQTPGHGRTHASDQDILLDDLSLPPNPVTGSSSVIIGMENAGKLPSDSDVRLVPDNPKGASDSDVRLATPAPHKAPSDSDVTLIADDTDSHESFGKGPGSSGDTAVRHSPTVGSSAEVAAQHGESDSDFELTPSSVIDALQPDSGSDFELNALEGSDEFDATPLAKPSDSDVTAAEPGLSGINLSRPSDSGINLQMASGLNLGQASSIELAPLSGDSIKSPPPKKAAPAAPAGKSKKALSETPPPGVSKGDKDIFDDTDFEVDALASDGDSDDKTQQLEAASDFELEESDTGSEVFAIDEEDVDQNAATSVGAVDLGDEEGDSGEFAQESDSGGMASSSWDVESEASSASVRAPATMLAPSGPSAEWGGLWVGFLGAATFFVLLLAFVGMDLVRNMYDIANDTPASGIVRSIAGMVGGG
jgi:hypothetical protein